MISKYEIGYPCMCKGVVVRVVGESPNGSWGEINGIRINSIPLVSTPHGSIISTGIFHLDEITEEGQLKMSAYEKELSESGNEMYAGKLNGFFNKNIAELNEKPKLK